MNRLRRSEHYTKGYVASSARSPLVDHHVLHGALLEDCGLDSAPSFSSIHHAVNSNDFFKNYIAYSFLRKYPFGGDEERQAANAWSKFSECERTCFGINQNYYATGCFNKHSMRLESILHRTRRIVAFTLGEVPDTSSAWYLPSGASFKTRRGTSKYNKLRGPLEVTPHALARYAQLAEHTPGWFQSFLGPDYDISRLVEVSTIVPGERLHFVMKDCETFRTIAIGPLINSILQRQLGLSIRRKLCRTGCDIKTAQVTHRELAKLSSVTGQFATIDLSSASDTISAAVVLDLLPLPWFEALYETRCHRYRFGDKWRSYQKFSAMGNGFTFELQTLLFRSIGISCCEEVGVRPEVWVYGDDIIMPPAAFPYFNEVLESLGFAINSEKTFIEGPFRESCGGHYYSGWDVKPFYLRRDADLIELIRLHNYLNCDGREWIFPRLSKIVKDNLRRFSALIGPSNGIDDHIHCDFYPTYRAYNSIQSVTKQSRGHRSDAAVFAYHMYRNYTGEAHHEYHLLSDDRKPAMYRYGDVVDVQYAMGRSKDI